MSVEICVCTSQADKARGYGARVYCVGVMDFDQNQVTRTSFCFPPVSH